MSITKKELELLNKVDSLQSFVEKMQNILSLITEVKVTLNNLKTEIEKIQEKRRSADIATMELGVASAACSIVGIGAAFTGGAALALAVGTIGILYGVGGVAIDLTTQHINGNKMQRLIKIVNHSISNLSAELSRMETTILVCNIEEFREQKNKYNFNDNEAWFKLANRFYTIMDIEFKNGYEPVRVRVAEALIKLSEEVLENKNVEVQTNCSQNSGVSIGVSILGIVSLVQSWIKVYPTVEAVDKVINRLAQIEAEIQNKILGLTIQEELQKCNQCTTTKMIEIGDIS